jgi:hypothetical protein
VPRGQGLDSGPTLFIEISAKGQVFGQAFGPVERPGPKCGQELVLVDDPVLEREQSEKKMPVGSHGSPPLHPRRDHARSPSSGVRSAIG